MIRFIQLPDGKYIHFKTPTKPGVSLIDDNDNILRKFVEVSIRNNNRNYKREIWLEYRNVPTVFENETIDNNTNILAFGRDRTNLWDIDRMSEPSYGLTSPNTTKLCSPAAFIERMDYRRVDGVKDGLTLDGALAIIKRVTNTTMLVKRNATTFRYVDSFLKENVKWELLGSVVQDELVLISNILYWMYIAGMKEHVDTILIEHTSQNLIDRISKEFPDIQVIGSSNS